LDFNLIPAAELLTYQAANLVELSPLKALLDFVALNSTYFLPVLLGYANPNSG
jgi:hypothetical protein